MLLYLDFVERTVNRLKEYIMKKQFYRTFKGIFAAIVLMAGTHASASAAVPPHDEGYLTVENVSYVDADEADAYRLERCRLDVYCPADVKKFATLVWFHGGGLEGGEKEVRDEFRKRGFAVVAVNYRLYPKCKCPAYIEDAAQAVAWTVKHIAEYGGDPNQVYVGGHSAGGYLTLMLVLARQYLDKYGLADSIVKAYPVSGQTMTHFTIKKERGMNVDIPFIDDMAPSYNVTGKGAPLVLITGDRHLEMLARYEENLHLLSILKHFGHPAELYEIEGFNHGTVLGPACYMIRDDIMKQWRKNMETTR